MGTHCGEHLLGWGDLVDVQQMGMTSVWAGGAHVLLSELSNSGDRIDDASFVSHVKLVVHICS
jgi:hypothetical protein